MAIFKTRNGGTGERGNGRTGMGNEESLEWGIFKSGKLWELLINQLK